MQVIMWLIFGCTLGLAGLVSRQKNAAQSLPLDAQPRRVGDLLVHVPTGWETARRSRGGRVFLRMIEPERDKRLRRQVQISQEPIDGNLPTAQAYLVGATENRSLRFAPFRFAGLGDGVLATAMPVEDPDENAPGEASPAMFACVIAAPTHRATAPIAVVIELVGPPIFGPAERGLVQQVADGIVLAPGTGTASGPTPVRAVPGSARLVGLPR